MTIHKSFLDKLATPRTSGILSKNRTMRILAECSRSGRAKLFNNNASIRPALRNKGTKGRQPVQKNIPHYSRNGQDGFYQLGMQGRDRFAATCQGHIEAHPTDASCPEFLNSPPWGNAWMTLRWNRRFEAHKPVSPENHHSSPVYWTKLTLTTVPKERLAV
jgi:hypothetical protein